MSPFSCKHSGRQKSIQNCKLPSFFQHQYYCIAPSTLVGSDGTRFQHFLQVTPNLINQWRGNSSKLFLIKGVSSVIFIVCSMEWVQPNSAGSNENTSWYLAKSQCALHLPALGSKNPSCLSPTHQTIYHVFA